MVVASTQRTMAQSPSVREGCQPRARARVRRVQIISRKLNPPQKSFALCFCADQREGCGAMYPAKRSEETGLASCRVPQALGSSCGSALELVFKKENSEIDDT